MIDADLLAAIREAVRAEIRAALPGCLPTPDRRLGAFLVAAEAFCGAGPWTACEILEDSRRAGRRDLLSALDAITGDDGDPAIRLGRWLQRQVDVEVDGRRLVRVKREAGSWLYAVESGESPA